ncbi:unnamed protein product [Mytilus edulis]|uniref:Mutator-like transposase domain-containing protein n=1 Tax=Mytilus edulis TaxID=6550 RepID=A0A8S3QMX8_MYTED|nr:unnamed protein product [Mytilus edulis]
MPVTKFKKGNKYSFNIGHNPYNKDQKSSEETLTGKVLRNGTNTHYKNANSKKSRVGRLKTVGKDDRSSTDYSLRKREPKYIRKNLSRLLLKQQRTQEKKEQVPPGKEKADQTEIATNKPGRRRAKVNVGLAVGLSKTPMAAAGYIRLCLSTNLPPSARGIQDACNKILPEIEEINKNDMKMRRERIKDMQQQNGKSNPNVINAQSDGMYNNNLYSGVGKTPFQPATQVIYSLAENVTQQHDSIGLGVHNKHCSKVNISNHQMSTNVWPDSGAYQAATDLHDEGVTKTKPTHQLDTRHISKNHRLFIKKNSRLCEILKGNTVKLRTQIQNKLAIDLSERCHGEICKAFDKYGNDIDLIRNKLTFAADAIVDCYQDWHLKCAKHSLLCKGLRNNNWLGKRALLGKKFGIKHTKKSSEILRECVNYRMCPAMMEKTKLNSNTQKVEAFNRALRTSIPKNVTFSRNTSGRAHSAAHSVNVGTANSIFTLCDKLGCSITANSKVHQAVKQVQKTTNMLKNYKKTIDACVSRSERRAILFDLYERHQEEIAYQKNMLLPPPKEKAKYEDHPYSKSAKKKKSK